MKKIVLIGAGAVGQSLAAAFSQAGIRLSGIYSAAGRSATRLAKKSKAYTWGRIDQLRLDADWYVLAVPDGLLADAAERIAAHGVRLKGKIFLHTSGALSSSELKVLKKKGASIGSWHPLQTFPKKQGAIPVQNVWFAVEGEAPALSAAKMLTKKIRAHAFLLKKKDKTIYHIAAVFASNYQVALFSVVEQLASAIGMPKQKVWKVFQPLITRTAENVFRSSPAAALTGPIARGDYKTISRHFEALEASQSLKHFIPLYSALGIEAAKLAKKRKR